MAKYGLTIAIPVFNEQKTVKRILLETTSLKLNNYEVIIIDDCSTDKSPQIIKNFIKEFKSDNVAVSLVSHKKNSGKGAGIKSAIKAAKGEYFVVQDADLEYSPKDIVSLIDYAQKNKVDVVYGSRFMGTYKNMPKANYFANKTYNYILRRIYKTKITDMHTCYKMVRTSLIRKIDMTSNGFGYATELVSKLLKRGVVIYEVPISFNGRTKKEGKKINFVDGIECIVDMLKYRFSKNG